MLQKIFLSIALFTLLMSCNHKNNPETKSEKQTIVGNDSDDHGCKASAGYTWSVIKNECIRIWEIGIHLKSVEPQGSSTSIATVILSDDQTKAELFVVNDNRSIILEKTDSGFAGKGYDFSKNGKQWALKHDGKVIYKE